MKASQIANETTFDLSRYLFDRQLAFVQDPNPFKVAVCSRRAGKTISCAAHLVDVATKIPGSVCLYITLSRNNAKKIVWPALQALNRDYLLGASIDSTELSFKFPNGSVIYLSGAKDQSEIEKFRGLAIKLCYIDESQSFKHYIKDLIDDILAPALMDHAGSLCLIGTPGPIPAGYFYDCFKSDTWSQHEWNFFQNPFIPEMAGQSHQALLDRELKRRGVNTDDPTIQREWFGRWTLDSDSLLLHYSADDNHYESLPTQRYHYILGIDLGFVDADALAILAWSESDAVTYLVDEVVMEKSDITTLVENISLLQKKYDISKMVIDEGGLGKKIAEEIRRRHHIPVQPADKARKMEAYALLNDALRRKHFKAKKGSRFAQDSYLVEIDRDKSTPDKIRVKDSFHSDIIDAVLYSFRESPAYTYEPPKPALRYGSKEWAEQQESEMEQQAVEHFTKEANTGFEWKDW